MSWTPQRYAPIVLDATPDSDAPECLEQKLSRGAASKASDFAADKVQSVKCCITTPPRSPALDDEQRRSRHNANERRRTNALKMRLLHMREEMEALEGQRSRLKKRDPLLQNSVLLDTMTLIDELRLEQQELCQKLRTCDLQNSTYQTIVCEFGANVSSFGVVDVREEHETTEHSENVNHDRLVQAPIFQRVLFRRPLPLDVVMACVKESYESIMAFRAERDFESLDKEVLGWRDKRLLNAGSLRFMLSQQFDSVPPSELVYKTWNILTDLDLYRVMQPRTVALELLQRVTEDCVIVRLSVSNGDKVHHSILLIARGRIDGGYLITYRSIPLSLGQQQFAATESTYVNLFNWYMFLEKVTPTGVSACEVTFGGSVENQSIEYLRYLMMEVVAGVVRWQTAVGHNKFRLTPS